MNMRKGLLCQRWLLKALCLCAVVLSSRTVWAGQDSVEKLAAAKTDGKQLALCDYYQQVVDLLTLYHNKDDPWLQKLRIVGGYQGQFHYVDSNLDENSRWDNRRIRLGVAANFLEDFRLVGKFRFRAHFDFDEDFFIDQISFEGIEDLFVVWEPTKKWRLAVGKHRPKITQEYSTSFKKLKTLERSQAVNQLVPSRVGGIVFTIRDFRGLKVDLGAFAGSVHNNFELPELDEGYGLHARFGRRITKATNLQFDYFYNDGDEDNSEFREYSNIFSINSTSKWDRGGLATDLIHGVGLDGVGDVYGLVLMPWYSLTDKLQGVFRYTYSHSNSTDGLNVQPRYERLAGGPNTGDTYNAFYLGLNYYICGHNLKLMNGIEYSSISGNGDNSYWSLLSGVRLFF